MLTGYEHQQKWYLIAVTINYESTPTKLSVTSSSVSVSWSQSGGVPRGLESYYQYVVEAADGRGTRKVTIPVTAGLASQTADIRGLKHNTLYHIKVRIDATHNSKTREGNHGRTLYVKTTCKCKYEHYFQSVDHIHTLTGRITTKHLSN